MYAIWIADCPFLFWRKIVCMYMYAYLYMYDMYVQTRTKRKN